MNELIDIHTHIIPGVDDGAQTDEVSKAMIDRYREKGFETIVATPHMPIIPDLDYVEGVSGGYEKVSLFCGGQGVEMLCGVEVRLSPEIWNDTEAFSTFGLAGTRYVLVDFPSGTWPHYAEDTLFSVQTLGLTPILAHPERYGWGSNHRDTPKTLVERGVLLQVTLGSLVGAFGSNAKSVSHQLIKSGLVHFTATDAHSAGSRMNAGIEGLDWLSKNHGVQAIERTLVVNPQAMLSGDPIEAFVPLGRRKLWNSVDIRGLLSGS